MEPQIKKRRYDENNLRGSTSRSATMKKNPQMASSLSKRQENEVKHMLYKHKDDLLQLLEHTEDIDGLLAHESELNALSENKDTLINLAKTNENEDNDDAMLKISLEEDTYSLMMLYPFEIKAYIIGIFAFCMQVALVILLLIAQIQASDRSTPFNIPVKVPPEVRVGQYLLIIFSAWLQSDVQVAIRNFFLLCKGSSNLASLKRPYEMLEKKHDDEGIEDVVFEDSPSVANMMSSDEDFSTGKWFVLIVIPNFLRLLQGLMVLAMSTILIIQNDNFIELLMNFSALYIISEFDDVMFRMVKGGFLFSQDLEEKCFLLSEVELHESEDDNSSCKFTSHLWLRGASIAVIFVAMFYALGYVHDKQNKGVYFDYIYPNCNIENLGSLIYWELSNAKGLLTNVTKTKTFNRDNINDGHCDSILNTIECKSDGGDCSWFNDNFPHCNVPFPDKIGDGKCDGAFFNELGIYEGSYNVLECGYDGGDCNIFNAKYPLCESMFVYKDSERIGKSKDVIVNITEPFRIGDGHCDQGNFDTSYCGWDGGDCSSILDIHARRPLCQVESMALLGNGRCDGGSYNTLECGWDNGDCDEFNELRKGRYEFCHASQPFRIGDGRCDIGIEYDNIYCGFDGGDCVGLGIHERYPHCPEGCTINSDLFMGDGLCESWPKNSTVSETCNSVECGFEEGDCSVPGYPDCYAYIPHLGDGICNNTVFDIGGEFAIIGNGNIASDLCGYDLGDCIESKYPNCTVPINNQFRLGDGHCDPWPFDSFACGWDGGDCEGLPFGERYPDCSNFTVIGDDSFDFGLQSHVGDGICNLGTIDSEKCKYDGGDCEVFYYKYPDCHPGDAISRLGNGICGDAIGDVEPFESYNTERCGYEYGDCIEDNAILLEKYPNCHGIIPSYVGDGFCNDGSAYNREECGWDGGDCLYFNSLNLTECKTAFAGYVGNSVCDYDHPLLNVLNTKECAWDGGDCIHQDYPECTGIDPAWIGDGICDIILNLNRPECGFDGGDCNYFNDFQSRFPECNHVNPNLIGNGWCNIYDGDYNTPECGWDNGDCIPADYPNCTGVDPSSIGSGLCYNKEPYNTEACGWDGGDCISFNTCKAQGNCEVPIDYPDCIVPIVDRIGDGVCHGMEYNVEACGWDGGDCLDFNTNFPNCTVDFPSYLSDGYCEGYLDGYNTESCDWDGGDCVVPDYPKCHADYPHLLGNGICQNFAPYNTADCGYDLGDCLTTVFSSCSDTGIDMKRIHDGHCDLVEVGTNGMYNSEVCDWDGGDCIPDLYPECKYVDPSLVGNGICDTMMGEHYNTESCGWDGGDCIPSSFPECIGVHPALIGDGECLNFEPYNTELCGWDGGDCIEFNTCKTEGNCTVLEDYPECIVSNLDWIGNGFCHGLEYNTEECGWDGGDCIEFNKAYPNCNVTFPGFIGNGSVQSVLSSVLGGGYNTEECGWEGGDNILQNMPDCHVDYIPQLVNGFCDDYPPYNTPECLFDGYACQGN